MDCTQYCQLCREWKSCEDFYSFEDEWCYSCDEAWSSGTESGYGSSVEDPEEEMEERPEDTVLPALECPKHHCIWKDAVDAHDIAFRSNARFLLHAFCYDDL